MRITSIVTSLGIIGTVFGMIYLQSVQNVPANVTKVDDIYQSLTSPATQVTKERLLEITNIEKERDIWLSVEQRFFSLHLPSVLIPKFSDVYMSIQDLSPITCGRVKFINHQEKWSRFIASRRSKLSFYEGDENLTEQEFEELFTRACQR